MGIDYSVSLAVGYRVTRKDLKKAFGKTHKEKFHLEPRFDPKTGKQLEDEKVIDRSAGYRLFLDEKEYDDEVQLVEEISSRVGATCYFDGDTGWTDTCDFIIGPELPVEGEKVEDGHLTVYGGCSLAQFADAIKDIGQLRRKLEDMGLELGESEVCPAVWIS